MLKKHRTIILQILFLGVGAALATWFIRSNGSVVVDFGPFQAVIPQVEGTAPVTGQHTFLMYPEDPVGEVRLTFIKRLTLMYKT